MNEDQPVGWKHPVNPAPDQTKAEKGNSCSFTAFSVSRFRFQL